MPVRGARATNAIDVVATYDHAGVKMTWLVECKLWATRVPKEKVWAFRSVLDDVGADRGVLLAEKGFQSGAIEAAQFSRMTLTSLAELREIASNTLTERRLLAIPKRVSEAYFRYWLLPKQFRIDSGLRPDVSEYGYSGGTILSLIPGIVTSAFAGVLPPENVNLDLPIYDQQDAVVWAEDMLSVLEAKLDRAESNMPPEVATLVEERRAAVRENPRRPKLTQDEIAYVKRFVLDEPLPQRPAPGSATFG